MNTYLLEIGLEEVPARFIPGLIESIQLQWEKQLAAHQISYGTVTVLATYRRLAVLISDIASTTTPRQNRIRGPVKTIACTADGTLTPAGQGFMKKNGLANYVFETDNQKEYIIGYITIPSVATTDKLPTIAASVITSIPLPIAMKWGNNQGPFIRPVHWILSLWNETHVPISLFGQRSGTWTRGHRFLTQSNDQTWPASGIKYELQSADSYIKTLKTLYVDVDPASRSETIVSFLRQHTDQWDSDLVEEVVYLTEFPTPILGQMDPKYMDLPAEPIIECIRKNQKYFPVIRNQQLTETYIIVADSVTDANKSQIREGNAAVLRARLDDVTFFWNEDQRLTPDIALEKLKSVVYQKGLGSVRDKVTRIQNESVALGTALGCQATTIESITQAAYLCKTDLVSQMVLELPKLQGIMGAIYANKWGYSDPVCHAIRALYDPTIPTALHDTVAFCIGVADRIDTVNSCFKNGLIPTGSQDPWGVRRAALAAMQALISRAQLTPLPIAPFTIAGLSDDPKCRGFLAERLKYILETDYGLAYDIVAAITSETAYFNTIIASGSDLTQLKASHPDGYKGLVETAVRIGRLSEKASHVTIDWELVSEEETRILAPIRSLIIERPSTPTVATLMPTIGPISHYFESVLIMADNPVIRENRLALLKSLDLQFKQIASFELLVI